jgi:hypothetical protein
MVALMKIFACIILLIQSAAYASSADFSATVKKYKEKDYTVYEYTVRNNAKGGIVMLDVGRYCRAEGESPSERPFNWKEVPDPTRYLPFKIKDQGGLGAWGDFGDSHEVRTDQSNVSGNIHIIVVSKDTKKVEAVPGKGGKYQFKLFVEKSNDELFMNLPMCPLARHQGRQLIMSTPEEFSEVEFDRDAARKECVKDLSLDLIPKDYSVADKCKRSSNDYNRYVHKIIRQCTLKKRFEHRRNHIESHKGYQNLAKKYKKIRHIL